MRGKSGPCNAYSSGLRANLWKEAPERHYRTYPHKYYIQYFTIVNSIRQNRNKRMVKVKSSRPGAIAMKETI